MAVEAGQCVGHILLIPHTISTVLRLAVYRISRKAVNLLPHKRYIVTAGAAACRHGRSHTAHLSIASVHTVALKYQRLVVAHLRPKRGGFIYRHVHTLATLIVDAQDGWHTVSAAAGLQCRRNALAVTDAARTGSRTGREARHERLHLQIGGRHQRPRRIAQVDTLVPLVDMVRLDKPHLRQYYQIDHPQAALHFQRQLQRCRQLLPALPRSTENAQAGFPAQIVFALRMGLQDLPQGRSSCDSGGHPSIERRGLANIGRQNLPIWLPQNIAIPKGDFQEHEFLIHQFRVFPPGRPGSHLPFAARWRMRRGHFPST